MRFWGCRGEAAQHARIAVELLEHVLNGEELVDARVLDLKLCSHTS